MPIRYRLFVGPNQRPFVARGSFENRLNVYEGYTDFSTTPSGLDKLEIDYQIQYSGTLQSVKKTEKRFLRRQISVVTDNLVFQSLYTGGVIISDVERSMLPILEGTEILPVDDARKRLHWVYQDDRVVKSINRGERELGRSARFSTSRKVGLLVTSIVVALLAGLLLYQRALRTS